MSSSFDTFASLEEPDSSLRHTKKRDTRASIEDHATRLVLARGISNVTVDDIAQATGISPRTFFNYFPTKEDAVLGIHSTEPTDKEISAFLTVLDKDEALLAKTAEFIVWLIIKDTKISTEIRRRRRKIKENEPQLQSAFFAAITARQASTEELVRDYLTQHPEKAATQLSTQAEARIIVTMAHTAVGLGIAHWDHSDHPQDPSHLIQCVTQTLHTMSVLTAQL